MTISTDQQVSTDQQNIIVQIKINVTRILAISLYNKIIILYTVHIIEQFCVIANYRLMYQTILSVLDDNTSKFQVLDFAG